jgi:hypothetical protein
VTSMSTMAVQKPQAGVVEVGAATGPRFAVRQATSGTDEIDDARGRLRVVLLGADAHDVEAARHYAARFNQMPDVELEQLAAAAEANPPSIDLGEDGLPTVTGYRQLYRAALDQLADDEPTWTRKRRERMASAMAEAFCCGAVEARSRRSAVAEEGCQ